MTTNAGLYLLLAAGFSRRFGSAKQLHTLPSGDTIISRSIQALHASGANFIVVIREGDTTLSAHLDSLAVHTLHVTTAEFGLASVIAEATRRIDLKNLEWLGVCLGDMPYIQPSTLITLVKHTTAKTIVRPRYLARCGHPVLFGRQFFSELKTLAGDAGAKKIIKAHPSAVDVIDLDDAMVLHDIDQLNDIIHMN